MQPIRLAALIAAVGVIGDVTLCAETGWVSLGPAGGRPVNAIVIDSSTPAVYAGTNAGIFRSADGGNSWSSSSAGMGAVPVTALALDPVIPSRLYAGTSAGVYLSHDSGSSWAIAGSGLPPGPVFCLAIDPSSHFALYAAFSDSLYKTINGGLSWAPLPGSPSSATALAARSSIVYAGQTGVWRSLDGGATWTPPAAGSPSIAPQSLVVLPDEAVYAASFPFGFYRSRDRAATWVRTVGGIPDPWGLTLAIDPKSPTTLYGGVGLNPFDCNPGRGGIYRTVDGGDSWEPLGILGRAVTAIAVDPSSPAVLAGTSDSLGLFKSADSGASWSFSNVGLGPPLPSSKIVVIGSSSRRVVALSNAGVVASVDDGETWQDEGVPQQGLVALATTPDSPTTLYAGSARRFEYLTCPSGLFKTVDSGAHWAWALSHSVVSVAVDPKDAATLYVSQGGGGGFTPVGDRLVKSTDGGESWTDTSRGLPHVGGAPPFGSLFVDPQTTSTLYLVAGLIYRSSDGGGNWAPLPASPSNHLGTLAIDPVSTSTLYTGGPLVLGIWKSKDAGQNWLPALSPPPRPVSDMLVDPNDRQTVYAATDAGVFRSQDGGLDWDSMNPGLPTLSVRSLAIPPGAPTTLYVGTDQGIFRIELPPGGVAPRAPVRVIPPRR